MITNGYVVIKDHALAINHLFKTKHEAMEWVKTNLPYDGCLFSIEESFDGTESNLD